VSRYLQSTAPTNEAVTLTEVLRHANITDDDTDTQILLAEMVPKATRVVERALNRQLITATWKWYGEEFPDEILLEKLPVATVSSIQYVDAEGTTQTLAATGYQTDLNSKDTPGRIKPAYGTSWPSTRGDTYNAVTVTFTAGYGGTAASVPATYKHAISMLCAHWYENREQYVTGTIVSEIPDTLKTLLATEDTGLYC